MEDLIIIPDSSDEVLKWALSANPSLEELKKIMEKEQEEKEINQRKEV